MLRLNATSLRRLLGRQEVILLLVLIALALVIIIVNPAFLSVRNLFRTAQATIDIGIFAMAVLVVLISGGIDVSFPSLAICAMYMTVRLIGGNPALDSVPLAFALSAGIGLLLGLFNGVFIALFRLPTLIVTLGTLALFRGFLLFFVGSNRIRMATVSESLSAFSRSTLLTVEVPGGGTASLHISILIVLALALLVALLLRYTVLGRSIYAIGGDRESAERVGVNIRLTQFFIYGFVGAVAGIGGMVFAVLSREADPFALIGRELDVIAAVVLGGASITGGRGTVLGTVLGVLLITMINSNLILLGIPSEWQRFVIGVLILLGTGIPVIQARWSAQRARTARTALNQG
jgi:simple sugar transport system permease protein